VPTESWEKWGQSTRSARRHGKNGKINVEMGKLQLIKSLNLIAKANELMFLFSIL
jgi:hypothetical protein